MTTSTRCRTAVLPTSERPDHVRPQQDDSILPALASALAATEIDTANLELTLCEATLQGLERDLARPGCPPAMAVMLISEIERTEQEIERWRCERREALLWRLS